MPVCQGVFRNSFRFFGFFGAAIVFLLLYTEFYAEGDAFIRFLRSIKVSASHTDVSIPHGRYRQNAAGARLVCRLASRYRHKENEYVVGNGGEPLSEYRFRYIRRGILSVDRIKLRIRFRSGSDSYAPVFSEKKTSVYERGALMEETKNCGSDIRRKKSRSTEVSKNCRLF